MFTCTIDDYPYGYHGPNQIEGVKNYKIDKIDPNPGFAKEVNVVHQNIVSAFETVSCYLMPFPGKHVAGKTKFTHEQMDQEFTSHLTQFVKRILSPENVAIKKVGGLEVT